MTVFSLSLFLNLVLIFLVLYFKYRCRVSRISAIDIKNKIEKLDLTLKATRDGLWELEIGKNKAYYSPRWYEMLGYQSDLFGSDPESWKSLIHPDERETIDSLFQEYCRTGEPFKYEMRMKTNDGGYKWILSRGQCIEWDSLGKPSRVIGTHTDIDQVKLYAEELKEARIKAEESDRLKSAFLANMSHEIRTPLNGIVGFSKLLAEEELPLEKRELFSAIISSNSEQLLRLISDIIDFARIESGQLDIFFEEFDLDEIMEEVFTNFSSIIELDDRKSIKIKLVKDSPDLSNKIDTDGTRLRQILNNLISNAVKFTESGYVEFGYHKADGVYNFFVKDTGVGIEEAKLETIFERFRQEDESLTRKYGGTGLGLTISRSLVENLGGELLVKSEKNKGSLFYFTLSE